MPSKESDLDYECSICMCPMKVDQDTLPFECCHRFCTECAIQMVENKLENFDLPTCPVCSANLLFIFIKEVSWKNGYSKENRPPFSNL